MERRAQHGSRPEDFAISIRTPVDFVEREQVTSTGDDCVGKNVYAWA